MIDQAESSEPIIGWRVWNVLDWTDIHGRKTSRLGALTAGSHGYPPLVPMVASCTGQHEAPYPEHECGVWAVRSRARADKALDNWKRDFLLGTYAIGRVILWGRVIEHDDGWRAQYAYPYELDVYTDPKKCGKEWSDKLATDLRNLYAVDAFGESWRNGGEVLSLTPPDVLAALKRCAAEAGTDRVRATVVTKSLVSPRAKVEPTHSQIIKVGLVLAGLAKAGKVEKIVSRKSGVPHSWAVAKTGSSDEPK